MYITRVLVSVFEFVLTVIMSVLIVYVNYVSMQLMHKDYDEAEELKKQNMAVAILLAALLFATGMLVQKGIYPVVSLVRIYFLTPQEADMGVWKMALFAVSQLFMVFVIAMITTSFTLRFYARLTTNIDEGKELAKGNAAVGIVLASVVLVVAMIVSEGLGSLTKALIPQPSIGRVQIMH
ncbi:MAG: DUF350 domain-containing protein [Elusimicrobia bacterium]|nr:DUF350 domain-containing protein [Elusimicrobiota bacterium]